MCTFICKGEHLLYHTLCVVHSAYCTLYMHIHARTHTRVHIPKSVSALLRPQTFASTATCALKRNLRNWCSWTKKILPRVKRTIRTNPDSGLFPLSTPWFCRLSTSSSSPACGGRAAMLWPTALDWINTRTRSCIHASSWRTLPSSAPL